MKKILVLIVIFGVFSSFSIKAETNSSWYNKFYVGAGVGVVKNFDLKKDTGIKDDDIKLDKYFDIFIGYNFNRYLSLNIGYQDFLKLKNYPNTTGQLRNITSNTFYSSINVYYPINNHSPYLSLGIGSTKIKSNIVNNIYSEERKGLIYTMGLGYDYNFNLKNSLGIKADYNYMPKLTYNEYKDAYSLNYIKISAYYKYSI